MSTEPVSEMSRRPGSTTLAALYGVVIVAGLAGIGTRWPSRTEAVTAADAVSSAIERAEGEAKAFDDSLQRLTASPTASEVSKPYIVVSAGSRHLWLRQGDSVLFEAGVATGKGDLIGPNASFATPRRRFEVKLKETAPLWVPPDWHFQEFAASRGLAMERLDAGGSLEVGGAVIKVEGKDVVKVTADGGVERFAPGREVVVGGRVIIPPFGTRQRAYTAVLGAYRLNLGDGYGIHGTNAPSSIGQAASHGCIRLRNEDISKLVGMVEVGTPVYIF